MSHSLTGWAVLWIACLILAATASTFSDAAAENEGQNKEQPYVLVVLGDSIAAGFGLEPEDAPPVRLNKALSQRGYNIEIRNFSVPGDTTSGGTERIDWSLDDDVDGVLIELGGNDVLRAISPKETERNLTKMITDIQNRGMEVFLAGMLAPPNLGEEYGAEFNPIYPRLSEKYNVPLYPFILEGLIGSEAHFQKDGIHPSESGVSIIVEGLSQFLIEEIWESTGTHP